MSDEPSQLRVVDESAMPPELAARISRLLCICFPYNAAFFSTSRAWHDSAPVYSIIGQIDGQLIAHIGVTDRTISVGNPPAEIPLRVAGVQNVAVAPEHRRQGWVDRAMKLSMDEAARRGFDAGLLFCGERRVPTYQRCGWKLLKTPVIRVEDGKELLLPDDNPTMFHPLRQQDFPPGRIHLRGNDW